MSRQETPLLTETGKRRFFYGYVVVAAGATIQLVDLGIVSTFGVFFPSFLAEFGWSRATISGASSLSFLLMGFLAILAGGLTDRFGPRIIMTTCGFFFALGFLLMSQLNSIWQLYLFYGVIVGIGLSAMDVVLLSTVARWFVKKRGMMSGIVKVGTGMGMFIMPLVAGVLIPIHGWRTSYIILGSIALVFVLSIAQLLRRDPGQMQQLPDNEERAATNDINSIGVGLSLQEAIHTRQFWMICAAFLTIVYCANTILVHIAPHAIDLGIPTINAASIISIIGGVSMVGRFVMGSAGDRIGNKLAMIVCFVVLLVSLLWLQLANKLWMLYLFAVVYGFAHGGFFALVSPTVAGLFGTRSHGVILGIVLCSGTLGGASGSVLAGHIFDITNSYQLVFSILVVFSIIGLTLTTLLKSNSEGENK